MDSQNVLELPVLEHKTTTTTSSSGSGLDILYGSVAGSAGKVVEYPFDTIKVRLQSQPFDRLQYKGPLDCCRQSIQSEGIRGLYRGVSTPILGAAAETASLFWTFNLVQSYVKTQVTGHVPAAVVSGAISGSLTSLILTPIELVKCRIQVQTLASSKIRYGIVDTILSVYRTDGIFGFWRGQTGTFFRESGGSAAWFGAYEYVGYMFRTANHKPTNSLGELMIAGAAAGISYNLSLFPADTIKSQMQTENMLHNSKSGFIETGRSLVRTGGIAALYRGCGITVCRSAPSSAIIFVTYEALKDLGKSIL